jgi:stringent starvation protein B
MNFENIFQPGMRGGVYSQGAKKIFYDLLKENYSTHERIIDRLVSGINSPEEYQRLGKVLLALFESGYMLAVEQHKAALEKLGFQANVIPSQLKSG